MEKLKADKAPELRSPHLGQHKAPFDADNNTIAAFTQGDLRRFIVNLLQSDPGAVPAPPKVDAGLGRGQYLGRRSDMPAGASDKDEFDLIADAANGVVWRFIYNASSSSAFKWEFVGGPPMTHRVNTQQSTSSESYTDLGTVGPQIVLPYMGDYVARFGVRIDRIASDGWGEASLNVGGAAPSNDNAVTYGHTTLAPFVHTSRSVPVIFITAPSSSERTVKVQYSTSGVSTNFMRRWLEITPIRIGPNVAGGG